MFKNISKSIIVLGIMFTLVLGLSYGTFIYTSDSYRATEMLVSKLSYGIDITASDATVSGKTVNVSSGKTSTALLKVTSLNKIDTKYGVDYKITKGTGTVKYASNTGWLPTGKISENNVGTYEKVVKVVIAATTDMSVDFTVTGGFPNNELTEVATGYTRITEKAENIISYNDTLTTVIGKESSNNLYGGESTSNYLQYPINEDNTKNIWRILGTYNGIGTKIVSNQVSTTTKSTLSTDLTSFYNTLEKPDNYILSTDKFACTNTSCTSSSYSKVGLISTSEYEMLGGINSYLASSESYFALDNGTIKNITSGGIEETSTTSGLRPAVYLQDYVTVTGSGTVSDPFKLKMPEYAVVLNVVNGSATLPSKMITRGENATYEITPNTGYKLVLSSNTCSNGTLSGNTFTITNVTSAQSCTITLTPESYTLTLDANGGSVSTTTKNVTYGSTYGDLPTPTRTGYTFNGWYNKRYSNTFSLSSLNDAWNYTSVASSGLKPGVTYWINIDKAELTSGTATEFTTLLYDFTSSKDLYRIENSFGTNVNYEIPVPSNIDTSHDIRILVYSGYAGNTNNNATKYTNYSIYGTNKTTNTKYTSTSVVETPANQELIASWKKNSTPLAAIIQSNGVNENGYRYEGSDPNNYIQMEKTDGTTETWRIIGLFPDGENGENVIRVRKVGSEQAAYDSNSTNHWPNTTLYGTLSSTYTLANYKNTVNYKMYLGGGYDTSDYTSKDLYDMERMLNSKGTAGATSQNNYSNTTTFTGSVGLMYPSDYGYGVLASNCARTIEPYSYNETSACYIKNWLHQGSSTRQWLISPSATWTDFAFYVDTRGYVRSNIAVFSSGYYYPVMALSADVTVTGSGTQSDPYVMN